MRRLIFHPGERSPFITEPIHAGDMLEVDRDGIVTKVLVFRDTYTLFVCTGCLFEQYSSSFMECGAPRTIDSMLPVCRKAGVIFKKPSDVMEEL